MEEAETDVHADDIDGFEFSSEDLSDVHPSTRGPARDRGREVSEPPLVYGSVDAFVADLLAPTYRRKVDGRSATWCLDWRAHPEAVVRLDALWRSWEHLRMDPALGMSAWLRDHLDYHLPILLSPDGPFRGCSPTRGHAPTAAVLPTKPAGSDILQT